ncbi:hypothetical protein WOLCODRAFT_140621 [Wolfiporia cocos MD-104 SS10]|uniref:DUF7587 domain-containing protein n=1 Tax=Wolfiporia cocos (strain MD-104) TaxID=742152 RepID=A0A2H3JJL6_WOLCO|nr:hypothetical protein WOLCODRAFT_140621 [Wolfiporia cocos MD-104 SS10]
MPAEPSSEECTASMYESQFNPTYADVAQHLDWTTRSQSPYISTSFSFAWAIWEATRRYHHGVKHDVEIAVIDAKCVASRAVTAVELLRTAAPQDPHPDHWKWYRYALEAQDVLVWGYIPGSAVLASIPLSEVLNKLPSYFLCPDSPDAKTSPLGRLGWDYARKRPSFRQFCQDMTTRFLHMPPERRLRDTTAGAVRLALCHLRPWFHRRALENFADAAGTVGALACVVARWSGQWWAREHPEIDGLVRCIVHIVGEEVREARRVQALADAQRMQDIVSGIEQLAETYQLRARLRKALPAVVTSPVEAQPAEVEQGVAPVDSAEVALAPLPEVSPTEGCTDPPPPDEDAENSSVSDSIMRPLLWVTAGIVLGTIATLRALAPDTRPLAHHLT